MAILKQLKSKINGSNVEVYPITHEEAVVDDRGVTLETKIKTFLTKEDVGDTIPSLDENGKIPADQLDPGAIVAIATDSKPGIVMASEDVTVGEDGLMTVAKMGGKSESELEVKSATMLSGLPKIGNANFNGLRDITLEEMGVNTKLEIELKEEITTSVTAEKDRALEAEKALSDKIDEIIENETSASVVAKDLADEVTRATTKETALQEALDDEIERAQLAETRNKADISDEVTNRKNADTELGNRITAEISRATAAEGVNAKAITAETTRATNAEESLDKKIADEVKRSSEADTKLTNDLAAEVLRATTKENELEAKINASSTYSRNEIDNMFSSAATNSVWKDAVATYDDIATTYPEPQDGWTVNVTDTDYTYKFDGAEWIVTSANAIPKATHEVDGLLPASDKVVYDGLVDKSHDHQNKTVLDGISASNVTSWNTVVTKVDKISGMGLSTNNFSDTYKNKLDGIQAGAQVNTITGVKGSEEENYRTGNVSISKDDIGLGSVGNFKAVSTVSNQGLSEDEKLAARQNIGAGASSFSGDYGDLINKPLYALSDTEGGIALKAVADANGDVISTTYLKANSKAVDSDKLDNHDSSYFATANELTRVINGNTVVNNANNAVKANKLTSSVNIGAASFDGSKSITADDMKVESKMTNIKTGTGFTINNTFAGAAEITWTDGTLVAGTIIASENADGSLSDSYTITEEDTVAYLKTYNGRTIFTNTASAQFTAEYGITQNGARMLLGVKGHFDAEKLEKFIIASMGNVYVNLDA